MISLNNFDVLIQQEVRSLTNFALSLTHNAEQSNDLVQETVLKAYKYKDQYQFNTNLRAWLFTILKNIFINEYNREIKRNTFLSASGSLESLEYVTLNFEKNLAESYFIRRDVNKAIEKLPEQLRNIFLMHFDGFKYHEIAEFYNIPLGTIKTKIFFAKKLLRNYLSGYATYYAPNSVA